jgi:hypothetical protein
MDFGLAKQSGLALLAGQPPFFLGAAAKPIHLSRSMVTSVSVRRSVYVSISSSVLVSIRVSRALRFPAGRFGLHP